MTCINVIQVSAHILAFTQMIGMLKHYLIILAILDIYKPIAWWNNNIFVFLNVTVKLFVLKSHIVWKLNCINHRPDTNWGIAIINLSIRHDMSESRLRVGLGNTKAYKIFQWY